MALRATPDSACARAGDSGHREGRAPGTIDPMALDPVLLSRVQFALTVMFHYLFPPLSIGLGLHLVALEALHLQTGDGAYARAARFFTRLFAVNFAIGVATGIVMEFQFGTNWATYSRFVGDVFGSALAAEGIFAFFLESGFLAVLVFGWDRVSPRVHFFSTVMVFLGSCFSAVWIVVANSWQHTPAGFAIVGTGDAARARITDFWAMVFNPSSADRLIHVMLGSFLTGSFFVASISAWFLLRGRHREVAERSLTVAVVTGALGASLMFVSGHSNANMVAEHQPAKLAAFEGHFHTSDEGTPLYLVGWPDVEAEEVRYGIAVPGMLSFLVHEDPSVPVEALDRTAPEDRPPVVVPFLSYHVMIGLGTYLFGVMALALALRLRGRLFHHAQMLRVLVLSVLAPYVANQAGWVAAEVGRQPWVVYGLLRTRDAVSPNVIGEHILLSTLLFSLIYVGLGVLWLVVMNEKVQHGPDGETRPSQVPHGGAA
jgi:cytochrome d ubiquinol oxidase subunit I